MTQALKAKVDYYTSIVEEDYGIQVFESRDASDGEAWMFIGNSVDNMFGIRINEQITHDNIMEMIENTVWIIENP